MQFLGSLGLVHVHVHVSLAKAFQKKPFSEVKSKFLCIFSDFDQH